MSGREHEPVAAFFPSIDRNLILDLDRHLRGGAGSNAETQSRAEAQPAPQLPTAAAPPVPATPGAPQPAGRPSIASVVGAVEQAAQAIGAMTERIDELENHVVEIEALNRQLEGQLDEAGRITQSLETRLRAETERANRLETLAARQTARANDMERDLSAVHGDLARVTEAITAALGLPEE